MTFEELLEKLPGGSSIKCPNCGKLINTNNQANLSERTFCHQTEPRWIGSEDGGFMGWEELHKCNKCETLFKVNNGT